MSTIESEICECCKDFPDYSPTHSERSPQVVFLPGRVFAGSHFSFINSRISDTLEMCIDLGMFAVQFYMGSQQTYDRAVITPKDIDDSKCLIDRHVIKVFTHSPVTYNLAGSSGRKSLAWSGNEGVDATMNAIVASLNYELEILSLIGAIGTVIHPGCYILTKTESQEVSEARAITAIATTLSKVTFPDKAKILLENCAGEKGKVSYNLNQMIRIRREVDEEKRENIGFCLDTAHAFGAGLYDLRTIEGVNQMFTDIDDTFANETGTVDLIHLNDSKVPFGALADRHALIGTGYIWSENMHVFQYFLQCAGDRGIPLVLETSPSDMYVFYQLLGEGLQK